MKHTQNSLSLRMNVITLGVKHIETSKQFYQKLGCILSPKSHEDLIIFKMQTIILCLYPVDLLAQDAQIQNSIDQGFRSITLSCNLESQTLVDAMLQQAKAAGAKILKEAQTVFWGGYSGYFADPDHHVWEVVWNPYWPLINGALEL